MNHKLVREALQELRPGAEWNLRGEIIEWLDKTQSSPAPEELDEVIKKLEALDYRNKRAAEYPPIVDQLEAIWEGGSAAEEMKAKIMDIKNKYPKPEEQ